MKKDTVVITGATAGVGRAAAKLFAEKGCNVALIARGEKGLIDTKKEIEDLGGKALVIKADVSNADEVENAAEEAVRIFGEINIWINNAMATIFSRFIDITSEEYKRVTEVTYLGVVYGTMAALKRMIKNNSGTILQVGSVLAYRGIPLQSAYCGAKHAVQGFTESLRSELIHDKKNIYLTMVQLPALNTPQFSWSKSNFSCQPQPVPPIYQPSVAAEAIYYASYHHRRELYLGFNSVLILIGNKFFPGFGDKYLAKKGFDSQLTNKKILISRENNLWNPVENTYGTEGIFTNNAKNKSCQFIINKNRKYVLIGILIILLFFFILW